MTQRDALRIALEVAIIALAAAALAGCAPPVSSRWPAGPLILDPDPPGLNQGPLERIDQIQERCCSIRMDWHWHSGWVVTTWADTGGIAADVKRVEAPTLDQALKEVMP